MKAVNKETALENEDLASGGMNWNIFCGLKPPARVGKKTCSLKILFQTTIPNIYIYFFATFGSKVLTKYPRDITTEDDDKFLMKDVSPADFCQEYQRQASPAPHTFCCSGSSSLNWPKSQKIRQIFLHSFTGFFYCGHGTLRTDTKNGSTCKIYLFSECKKHACLRLMQIICTFLASTSKFHLVLGE